VGSVISKLLERLFLGGKPYEQASAEVAAWWAVLDKDPA
jgi:hypothetical protein